MTNWTPTKIKRFRKKLNLTQVQFGDIFGITGQHVSDIECGRDNPSQLLQKFFTFVEKKGL